MQKLLAKFGLEVLRGLYPNFLCHLLHCLQEIFPSRIHFSDPSKQPILDCLHFILWVVTIVFINLRLCLSKFLQQISTVAYRHLAHILSQDREMSLFIFSVHDMVLIMQK